MKIRTTKGHDNETGKTLWHFLVITKYFILAFSNDYKYFYKLLGGENAK